MKEHPFEVTLTAYTMITDHVLQLAFTRNDHQVLSFTPGQFITFLLPHDDGKILRRSYSLANIPEQTDAFDIAVAPVTGGFATEILFNLQVGDQLLAIGPKGQLTLKQEDATVNHIVLVATNTGVAPYRSMLSTLSAWLTKEKKLKVTLLLGVRYAKDILYATDFLAMADKHARFDFRVYLSRETNPTPSYAYKGYVQDAFSTLDIDPYTDVVFLCGNPNMIDQSVKQLEAMGLSGDHIRREKYLSSKVSSTVFAAAP